MCGRWGAWWLRVFKSIHVPTSNELFADNTAEFAKTIQAYMDAVDANGQRGGWEAGRRALEAARKPGAQLFTTPEWLLITVFMGLPGTKTPKTAAQAREQLQALKQLYTRTGHRYFLLNEALAEVVRQLKAIDDSDNSWTAGVLKKLFEVRKDPSRSLGRHAREAAVLMGFKQKPEYVKFLSADEDGTLSLPRGTSYEEFAAAMLANAYGPYPF